MHRAVRWKKQTLQPRAVGLAVVSQTWGLRSLSVITSAPLATLPDVAFRVQLVKAQLQVDVTPTVRSVNQLLECLLTELEGEVKYGKPVSKARSVKEEAKPSSSQVSAQASACPEGRMGSRNDAEPSIGEPAASVVLSAHTSTTNLPFQRPNAPSCACCVELPGTEKTSAHLQ